MNWSNALDDLLQGLAFIGVYAVLIVLARVLIQLTTPGRLNHALAENDNAAVGITLGGYYIATSIIFVGVLAGPSAGFVNDLISVSAYSLGGLALLTISSLLLDKLVLTGFSNITAILEQHNTGMAAVRFGFYVATGLIAAGSIFGQGGGPLTMVAFFALGQVVLFVFAKVYDWTTPFDLEQEIAGGNVAAGVSFGGSVIALGIIVARAVSGDFVAWGPSLAYFAVMTAVGVVLLQILRVVMDKVLLAGHDLNREIAEDRNLAAGFVEMAVAIAFALVLAALM
jgi:uncharacterized membrane protein YjfL (UPF0719 family)